MKRNNLPDMTTIPDHTTVENFYSKAYESYTGCVQDELYSFLSEEMEMPLSEIKTKNDSVEIRYSDTDPESLQIGIRLSLWTEAGEELGYYELVLDSEYKVKDDFLVFN